jgi:hypothetical protein
MAKPPNILQRVSSLFLFFLTLPPVVSFLPNLSIKVVTVGQRAFDQNHVTKTLLYSEREGDNINDFTREVRMREEAESPFRKVRFLLYFTLGGGAATSLVVSAARVAAALSGINPELLQESSINIVVDALGIAVLAFLFKRDLDAQESRLKRASRGAELAKLMVRGSKAILSELDASDTSELFTASLSDFRRGRGIEKRIVIAAGGQSIIEQIIKEATRLEESLTLSDLIVIPVLFPDGRAPNQNEKLSTCLAFPLGEAKWRSFLTEEAKEAIGQGVDVEKEGFCVILKKNGRVGQRTRGVFLDQMVGEVTQRREMGFDVKNI